MKRGRQKSGLSNGSKFSFFDKDYYLKGLADNIKDAVAVFDSDKKIITINSVMKRISGLRKKKIKLSEVLENLEKKIKTRDNKKKKDLDLERAVDKVINDSKKFHIKECSVDGKFFEVSINPIQDKKRGKFGGTIVMRDITRLKEIKEMKTEFISIASHQLRTPLTSIKLFMEMLANERDGTLNKKQKEYVSDVRESTERMISLVNNLLNVSRLEEGKLKIEPRSDDLIYFIKDVIHGVMQLANDKNIEIKYNYPQKELPPVKIDRTLLHQVVHNLLTNAIKYSPSGQNAVIEVNLKNRKNDYLISVKDSGIGISQEERKRIFEKFFRSDNAVKAHAEGSGLGLYVAKIIIESSGADMWLRSRKGKGTTFYISIPHEGMSKKEGAKSLVN